MTDATAWDRTSPAVWLTFPNELLVDAGLVPGPERPPRRPWFTRRQRIVALVVCAVAPFVGWGIGSAAEPDTISASATTSTTSSEYNPTVPDGPPASGVTMTDGTSTTTSTGEVTSTTAGQGDPVAPLVPTSPTTILEPTTTEPETTTTTTPPPTVPEPVVDWYCVGDATWGQGPTYNLAMWQAYGGTGLPEDNEVLWPEVAHSMYTNEGLDIPQDCVT